ncbi:hypothetical protein SCHPADRAFT_698460 [Schizopora paradoxa]|uniref:Uncharacterized protein n=1 Tax=Schizopora paradoxa TaxID=27342 RepID=A0A0H2R9L3_9AGAM|nr:hypothetical protein SCHPADRAFT_698460 [Schizopora paradoxa]
MIRYRRQESSSFDNDSAVTAIPSSSTATGDAGTFTSTASSSFSQSSSAAFAGTTDAGGGSSSSGGDDGLSTTGGTTSSDGGFSSGDGFGSPSASTTTPTSTTPFETSPPPSTFTSSSSQLSQAVVSSTSSSSSSLLNPTSSDTDTSSSASGSSISTSASGGTVLSTSFATIITSEDGFLTTIVSPVATLNVASTTSGGSKTNSGAIAGAVVGAVALIAIGFGLIFCYRWRQNRRSSRAHRLLPTPRSVLLADEDNFDLAADAQHQTRSRGIFGSIIRHRGGGDEQYSDAGPSSHYGSTQQYNPSTGHVGDASFANDASLASMDAAELSGLDHEPPPRLMRARASQTGSMFEELGIWPPPGEGSRLSDPLMTASNVDLTGIVENVMGPGEGSRPHGSGTSTPTRPSRLRGGAESETLLAHMDSESRSPTEASHNPRSRESTLSMGSPNSPGFIPRDLSASAHAQGGNERSFTYQSSEFGSGEGSPSLDSPNDRWRGQSVMHSREWSGSFTSQSALLPHSDVAVPPPSAFRSSLIFSPPVNANQLPPGAAPALVPGFSSLTPPGSPGNPSSPKYLTDRAAARLSSSSSKAAEAAEERRRSRLSQLAISNPDEVQPRPLRLSTENPLPPIPVIEHDLVIESPDKLVDDSSPFSPGTLSVPEKARNASLTSLPSVYSNEGDDEPSALMGSILNQSRSMTTSTASPGPSRQTTVTEDGILSPSSDVSSPTGSAALTRNSTVSTTFSPTARARVRASIVQVPFPSALSELGRFFSTQSGSTNASSSQLTPVSRERDILEEIPPRYDMLRRDSELTTRSKEDSHPSRDT